MSKFEMDLIAKPTISTFIQFVLLWTFKGSNRQHIDYHQCVLSAMELSSEVVLLLLQRYSRCTKCYLVQLLRISCRCQRSTQLLACFSRMVRELACLMESRSFVWGELWTHWTSVCMVKIWTFIDLGNTCGLRFFTDACGWCVGY